MYPSRGVMTRESCDLAAATNELIRSIKETLKIGEISITGEVVVGMVRSNLGFK